MAIPASAGRPRITLREGYILHDGDPCRVVLREGLISVGCTDITPAAAQFILDHWKEQFEKAKEVVLQNGQG